MTTRTYQNFDLLITRTASGYNARVIHAPVGQANVDFVLPFSLDALRNFAWLSGRSGRHLRPEAETSEPPLDPQTFGAQLYTAVFADDVGKSFLRSLDRAGGALRIRLHLDATPELADLPWEYLYATDLARPLALSQETPLVRYLDLAQPEEALMLRPPLRILGIVSDPRDVRPLQVEQEWRQLHDVLADLQSRHLLVLERLAQATWPALQARLRGEAIHILHFIGHGDFDVAHNTGGLIFEDETGRSSLINATDLATLLHDHRALRLVFLNACQGAQGGRSDPFAGVAQKLVQQGAPAVLAMQFPVSDKAAIALAGAFYRTLAEGDPVDAALSEARKAIALAGDDREWGTPVLFSRSPDNRLLTLWEGDARPLIERQAWEPETVLVGGGAFIMGCDPADGIPASETPAHKLALPDFRIGKYPVTVREFAAFVKETKAVDWVNSARDTGWFNLEPLQAKLDHPVTGVSWYDALAYCKWLSGKTGRRYRLPSEAEWEKAASWSAGVHNHLFSGNSPTKRQYSWEDEWSEGRCNAGGTETTPVAAHPSGASAYGCEDLLGNVQEWTCSLWGSQPQQSTYGYPYNPGNSREVLRVEDLPAQVRLVHRGGSYKSQPNDLRCTARGNATPGSQVAWRGFRVVMVLHYAE
ncbi:MAG: SUMF1/EgtB/PvdO family nonheme iron enzyme [Caldilineaceae bacterium]